MHVRARPSGASTSHEPLSSEPALVERMLRRDESAWAEFQRRYARLATACISRALGPSAQPSDVEEVHAIALAELLEDDMRKLRTFDPSRGRLSCWFGTVAKHTACNHARSLRRSSAHSALEAALEVPEGAPTPDERMELAERHALTTRLFRSLSSREIEFAALYYGEELPAQQIADQLQISIKTVYTRRFRIQSRLGSVLAQEDLGVASPLSTPARAAQERMAA
jgi:RNA polymerase sigma-70 factor (ECF subfamily)